jgi:hypothetical protein
MVRFGAWRGRREAARELKQAPSPVFRSLVQINLIRPR